MTSTAEPISAQENELIVSVATSGALPEQLATHVQGAIRHAVLSELATLNVGPGYRVTDLAASKPASPAEAKADTNVGIIIIINTGR